MHIHDAIRTERAEAKNDENDNVKGCDRCNPHGTRRGKDWGIDSVLKFADDAIRTERAEAKKRPAIFSLCLDDAIRTERAEAKSWSTPPIF